MQVAWDKLTPRQLEKYLVWTYVDPHDGEVVAPYDGDFPTTRPPDEFLFSARFRFQNGSNCIGFVHGVAGEFEFTEACFGALCPYVAIPNHRGLMNLFAFPGWTTEPYQKRQFAILADVLGCKVLDCYPIRFDVERKVEGLVSEGTIPGLMFYRVLQKRTWFRRPKTGLMIQLPGAEAVVSEVKARWPMPPTERIGDVQ